jgi:hypothetical protein
MRASCRKRSPVETASSADYHLRMPGDAKDGQPLRGGAGPAPRVERRDGRDGDAELVVHGVRATDRISMRPSLFAPLHRAFTLGAGERLAARSLLALLRLPVGPRLLRAWHARRSA